MEEHADVGTGKAHVRGFGNTYTTDGDNQLPAIMWSVVVHAGKNAFEERGLALCVRAGNGKDFPLPYAEAGYRPAACRQLEIDRVKLCRTAERDADPLLGAGNPEERAVLCEGPGKP